MKTVIATAWAAGAMCARRAEKWESRATATVVAERSRVT